MGIFLVSLISSIIMGIILSVIAYNDDISIRIMFLTLSILAGLTLSIIVTVISSAIANPPNETERIEIVNLNNDTRSSGSVGGFILFTGKIEEKEYYFYMKEREDGGFQTGKIETYKTVIYEDTIDPHIVLTIPSSKATFWYFPFKNEIISAEIHVPKNTIVKEFNVN